MSSNGRVRKFAKLKDVVHRKPHEYHEAGLHPSKVGVWCAISRRQIDRPIFIMTTITSDMYSDILMQFIALLEEDERDCIFQQDGVQPHTSKESMAILCGFFGDRLVSTGLGPPFAVRICPSWTIYCGDT